MRLPDPRIHRPSMRVRRCAICGSTKNVLEHHLGGWRHAPFFTLPLCEPHHAKVTALILQSSRQNGIDLMQGTTDVEERIRRARTAGMIFLWYLDDIARYPFKK